MLSFQLRPGDFITVTTQDGFECQLILKKVDRNSVEVGLAGPQWFRFVRTKVKPETHRKREFGPDKSQGDYLRQMLEGSNGSSSDDP